MRLSQALIESFARFVANDEAVALVTVLSTAGSTYSKQGSQMLIGADGSVHGLLSGGCLENDLAERAANVIESGQADWVEYDLRDDDDVFGLGVGCEGAMRLQIQPLLPASGYEPFAGWLATLATSPTVDASFATDRGPVTFTLDRPYAVLLLGAGQDADPLLLFCRSLGWRVMVLDHRPAYIARIERAYACDCRCVPVGSVGKDVDLNQFDAAI
ncbi:MAG: hypothetical protein OEY37_04350, partial [Gammaproteobacteria bacterium]|nr:hypothetical protein [Gammaproteobacteria bacterium]